MKKTVILIVLSFAFIGCRNSAQTAAPRAANNNVVVQNRNDSAIVSSHSGGQNTAPLNSVNTNSPGTNSSSSGGSPMAKAIDVSQMTADIEKADKILKSKPNDAKAKHDLAEAYFIRAFALTDAAQYRSALGDFRKGLKLNPENADAKNMHDQIISIFQSINREPPKEGEEPPPLSFGKTA